MKKRFLMSGIAVLAMVAAFTSLAAATDGAPGDRQPVTVYINGRPTEFSASSFIYESTTYVPLRDCAMALGADSVAWTGNAAIVQAPGLEATAAVGRTYLVANGRYLFTPGGFHLSGGTMMVPVRALARAFDATVAWNDAAHAVFITTGSGAITPGGSFYNETDVHWLSRIISAEARGESFAGKIAVGGVIMNRIASPQFPNSVREVIFDRRHGIQFTPAYSGAINNTPNEECIIAAKIALDGGNTAGDSLYFASVANSWASRVRPYSMSIGNHRFYA